MEGVHVTKLNWIASLALLGLSSCQQATPGPHIPKEGGIYIDPQIRGPAPPGSTTGPPPTPRPSPLIRQELNLLALGDSVMWGTGLMFKNKYFFKVKNWLESYTNSQVNIEVQAHTGANIFSDLPEPIQDLNGDVPDTFPTITSMAYKVSDPNAVDIILLQGCANDFDFADQALFSSDSELKTRNDARNLCHTRMSNLLRTVILRWFPYARVVVVGYYPVFTNRSPQDLMNRLSINFFARTPVFGVPGRAAAFYLGSSDGLRQAISDQGNGNRITFVAPDNDESWGFGVPGSKTWSFEVDPGKYPDQTWQERVAGCWKKYDPVDYFTLVGARCRNASMYHPNEEGADWYADAVVSAFIAKAWVSGRHWARIPRPSSLPVPPTPPPPPRPTSGCKITLDKCLVNVEGNTSMPIALKAAARKQCEENYRGCMNRR